MNKPFKPSEELISLNEELHTEFSIQELEQRLETDPLMFANLMDLSCTVPGALVVCSNGGNFCDTPEALTVNNMCEIKFKDGGDVDICSPICDNIL